MHRKDFIRSGFLLCTPYVQPLRSIMRVMGQEDYVMTVNGHISSADAGFTLTHEHILVDFIGADKITTSRYNESEVYDKALPVLQEAVNPTTWEEMQVYCKDYPKPAGFILFPIQVIMEPQRKNFCPNMLIPIRPNNWLHAG